MMQTEDKEEERNLPSLRTSLIAPVVTIVLLALRPAVGINIDPLIALPVGGLCGAICMKQWKNILPIIAISNTDGDRFRRLPIERATGATVITATSIKTPTVQSNIVASANAINTRFSPILFIIALEMTEGVKEVTPAVLRILTAGVLSGILIQTGATTVITVTVSFKDSPPNNPPTIAPIIRLYVGESFLMINSMDNESPINAPIAVIEYYLVNCFMILTTCRTVLSMFSFVNSGCIASSSVTGKG